MERTEEQGFDVGHPAPYRDKIDNRKLILALFGAPAAWLAQLLIGFATPDYLCFTTWPGPDLPDTPAWLGWFLAALNLGALALGVAGLFAALSILRRTRDEHRDHPGDLLDSGEGRSKFLAIWGLFTSLLFAVAILFNTISLFLVPLCRV